MGTFFRTSWQKDAICSLEGVGTFLGFLLSSPSDQSVSPAVFYFHRVAQVGVVHLYITGDAAAKINRNIATFTDFFAH